MPASNKCHGGWISFCVCVLELSRWPSGNGAPCGLQRQTCARAQQANITYGIEHLEMYLNMSASGHVGHPFVTDAQIAPRALQDHVHATSHAVVNKPIPGQRLRDGGLIQRARLTSLSVFRGVSATWSSAQRPSVCYVLMAVGQRSVRSHPMLKLSPIGQHTQAPGEHSAPACLTAQRPPPSEAAIAAARPSGAAAASAATPCAIRSQAQRSHGKHLAPLAPPARSQPPTSPPHSRPPSSSSYLLQHSPPLWRPANYFALPLPQQCACAAWSGRPPPP